MNRFYHYLILTMMIACYSGSAFALEKQARVVGGERVAKAAYPWVVAVMDSGYTPLQGQFCGGSLIAPQWVLTAAHCVTEDFSTQALSPDAFEVVFNFTNLRDAPTPIAVTQVIVHPEYETRFLQHDLALLKLAEPTTVRPVALLSSEVAAEELLTVSSLVFGWGQTNNLGQLTDALYAAELPIMPNAKCDALLSESNIIRPGEIFHNHLCAGAINLGRDSCLGDSGGPLVIVNKDGQAVQIGIVSFGGAQCGRLPGVYTRVSSFDTFISMYVAEATFMTLTSQTREPVTVCDPETTPVPAATSLSVYTNQRYVELTWLPVDHATGYTLFYLPINMLSDELGWLDVGNVNELAGILTITQSYYLAIQAYNCAGVGTLSNVGLLWFNEMN